jgi:ABC-2 type transport system permease protein
MSDLWTMVWKEWRDSLFPGGKMESLRPIIFITLLGVIWPWIIGLSWLSLSTPMVLFSVWFPFFFILNYIGDAFAGERERHTLETLLASRMSDRAILWGKVIATVGYIWGMALIASLLGTVVVNLTQSQSPWMFYTPVSSWLVVLIFSLLACLLSASGGILVSLHSATVRQAQQTMLLGSLVLSMAIFFGVRAIPEQVLAAMSTSQIALAAMLFLAIIDAILLAISMASFHRARLILS